MELGVGIQKNFVFKSRTLEYEHSMWELILIDSDDT
jgi:hypothetical protein